MPRYGLILMANTIREQIECARLAERHGLHSVWCTEFFHQNAFVRMTAVAGATERVQVGSAIAYAFMRTPMLAASAAMDIDEISGGRAVLGLGTGTRSMNVNWYSMPFDAPPAPRVKDAIRLIRAAFEAQKGGGLDYQGPHYKVKVPQFARPGAARAQVPIYLAAVNKGMIRAAAAVADGLIGHPIYTRKYIRDVVLPELEGSPCELVPYVLCAIHPDRDQARREAKAQIAFYNTTRIYHSILDVHGWRSVGETIAAAFRKLDFQAMEEAVTDELCDAIAITGTPDDVRDQIKQWDGLADHRLLYTPAVGLRPERVRENVTAMCETFGS